MQCYISSSTTNTWNVGGTVVDVITEEHLKDLVSTEMWQDQLNTLSDSLGFSLSIYSHDGTIIFAPMNSPPFCQGFCLSSSSFKSHCESYCHPFMMNAISKGKPDVYKCYSKIMSFALPIEYMDEHAVIVGQGSFSSYEDFRECMNILSSNGLDT